MPTTSPYLLPYPAASDPADVPTDMGELANAVDDVIAARAAEIAALDTRLDVLEAVGPAAPPEVAYASTFTPVSVTGTSEGAATQILTLGSVTYPAAIYAVEFWAPAVIAPAATLAIILRDGATIVGRYAFLASNEIHRPFHGIFRNSYPAGARTFSVAGHVASGSGTVSAGGGGSASLLPAFLRVMKVG